MVNLRIDPFFIGNVRIPGRLLLAPMDGFTDSPFRLICRSYGSAASYSEFVNGLDVKYGHPHLKTKTYFNNDERPFCYQVFDDDPARLLHAALLLNENQPDFIDINMGCSAKNVSNRGAGAGLLKDPQKIALVTRLLTSNLTVPVTAKIRLGWDDSSKNYLDVARILADNGICAITVHARTRKQEYSGKADWNAIAEIKNVVSTIPILGNGDVTCVEEAENMINRTGCDAVMIGRASLGNPWIFSGRSVSQISPSELLSVITRHIDLMISLYNERIGVLMFRKHLARYLYSYLITPKIRKKVFSIETRLELLDCISQILNLGAKNESYA